VGDWPGNESTVMVTIATGTSYIGSYISGVGTIAAVADLAATLFSPLYNPLLAEEPPRCSIT